MNIQFTKMHALGNDFIVIDAIRQHIQLEPRMVQALARRDTGIGFDQCLLIEQSQEKDVDFFYRIFNANGQEVGQCGNGARCIARFIHYYGLTSKKHFSIATLTTKMELQLNQDETVTVCMGQPKFEPSDIPLSVAKRADSYLLPLNDGTLYTVHAVNVGNPHAVSVVNDLTQVPIATLGQKISEHLWFPEQTNVGFMRCLNDHAVQLRVYERGCGETKACGSGAVAAAAIGRLYYQLAAEVQVHVLGGVLTVIWPDVHDVIYLTGPASFVYEGVLMPCAL